MAEKSFRIPGMCACGAGWQGSRTAHCSGCHQTFTTVTNFDRHRTNSGEHGTCLDPAAVGLQLQQRAGYQAWAQPNERYVWESLTKGEAA